MPHHALILLLLGGPVRARQDLVCEPDPAVHLDNQEGRDATIRVLFLGNSHTYVNQVPCLVQRLAASMEQRVNLARPWDFLVLQEQGHRPIEDPERTSAAVRRFGDAARRVGARLVLYIPPAGRGRSSHLQRVAPVFQQIAAATQSTIAPAAQAWQAVGRADSTLDLYDADGIHANAVGSYLTACVLLAAITERSPHGVAPLLLRRPYGSAPGTAAILDTLGRSQATALQAAAWKAVRESRSGARRWAPEGEDTR